MRLLLLFFLTACSVTATVPTTQHGTYELHFCPDCQPALENILSQIKGDCAFYDLDTLDPFIDETRLLIFEENDEGFGTPIAATDGGLMHHKFCIFGDIIMTGSMNPTKNGMTKNDNVLFFIQGAATAENYRNEYRHLQGRGKRTPHPIILHNTSDRTFIIENYFCPRDHCEQQVLDTLDKANHSVRFLVFSFTSDAISDKLIQLHRTGIDVQGILEPSQFNAYSEEKKLQQAGIPIIIDQSDGKLHHKTFIVDNTVIFGSYNPTANGNTRNNENLLIIHDAEITSQFRNEYHKIAQQ